MEIAGETGIVDVGEIRFVGSRHSYMVTSEREGGVRRGDPVPTFGKLRICVALPAL